MTFGFRPPSSDIGDLSSFLSPISEEERRKPNVLNRIENISYGHLYMKKEDENQM
jgi:hypothetical protein